MCALATMIELYFMMVVIVNKKLSYGAVNRIELQDVVKICVDFSTVYPVIAGACFCWLNAYPVV